MKITVFTPTYNRADLIERVYSSLCKQTYKDFEWLVIDDGFTDRTSSVIDEYQKVSPFPIRYYQRINRGKVACINEALDLAIGYFFLVFDSDDWCVEHALERFVIAWLELSDQERECYSGVSSLKAYMSGEVVGEDYLRMSNFGESYIDRESKKVRGDKWEFIRTDVHRCYRYDIAEGERYMAPSYAWLRIGAQYKTVFLNEVLGVIEYQADGISRNIVRNRVFSPVSACRVYRSAFFLVPGSSAKIRFLSNHIRFRLHGGDEVWIKSAWLLLAVPIGFAWYCSDRIKIGLVPKLKNAGV